MFSDDMKIMKFDKCKTLRIERQATEYADYCLSKDIRI